MCFVHESSHNLVLNVDTLETIYKAVICPRKNLPYKQIFFTNDLNPL